MLAANICSIQKGGIILLKLENHLNSKYQDVTSYVIKKSNYDKGTLFKNYVDVMVCEMNKIPQKIVTFTSDDIFDYLLDLKSINSHVNRRKFNDIPSVRTYYEFFKSNESKFT